MGCGMMTPLHVLLALCSLVIAKAELDSIPQPTLTDIKYWGSACPEGGLNTTFGTVDTTKNSSSLTFELANFLPTLGSFGSSLRMCSIVTNVKVDEGWRLVVNKKGTYARGSVYFGVDATLFLRTTYSFAERTDVQSVGMFNARGPMNGSIAAHVIPDGDQVGALGSCGGGELDIELQSRAVSDASTPSGLNKTNGTAWQLTTDIEVSRC